ncbi:MAG: hypothetical protein ABI432_18590 [Flavobacteriales bacterium]
MTTPEKKPDPPDEFDGLELIHRRVKEEQEAWRKLLESLENLKKKPTGKPHTEKPSK